MRAAIYTRYSSDNQSDRSTDDQIALVKRFAEREGLDVGDRIYSDEEISAATPTELRQHAKRMIDDAMAGEFDVLLIEALDRGWRDIVDQERIIRRLEHRGIRIVGVSDGYDSRHEDRELQRGVRGLFNQNYLRDLAKKVHRGLTGQFDRGLFAGGMSYGYRSIEVDGGRRLEINRDEAKWIVWIFEQYAAGISTRAIAHELNRRGVPSPRGSTWVQSAIYGSPAKGTGILNNRLYVGRYIWNRSKFVKNPDTGKRRRIERPRDEWKIAAREDLRIVSNALWAAARDRIGAPGCRGGGRGAGRRPVSALGGILRCGECGGAVVVVSADKYGCAAHKDRGPTVCSGVYVRRDATQNRLLSALRDELLSPASLAYVQTEIKRLRSSRAAAIDNGQAAAKTRLAALEREINNLVDAIAAAGWSKALQDRLAKAEQERDRVRQAAQLSAQPNQPDAIQNVLAKYKTLLADLPGAIKRKPDQARAALQQIFGQIRLVKRGGHVYAEMTSPAERILLAAAGGVDNSGSGGAITELSTVSILLK